MTAQGATLGDRRLTVVWAEAAGDRRVSVSDLTITIVRNTGSVTVVPATSDGIRTHRRRGHYSYIWENSGQPNGLYTVTWNAVDSDGDAVSVSEVVTISTYAAVVVDVDAIIDYIGTDSAARWEDHSVAGTYPAIEEELAAETFIQSTKVNYRVPTDAEPYPDNSDLDLALKKRVKLALVKRAGGSQTVTLASGAVVPAGFDPDIRRLESGRRKVALG